VVADGLMEGEEIAVNGVFKIDAAAQLEGKPSMMNPGGGKVSLGHDHGSMGTEVAADEVDHSVHQAGEADKAGVQISTVFKEQLQKVYDSYIIMTDAFVATKAEEVSLHSQKVKSELQKVDMTLLQGEAHMVWMTQLETLNKTIEQIASSKDISEQRLVFAEFNNAFYRSLKSFGLHQGTTYYQYCPMANGDVGAYWFSNEKDILNPYFGDEMLKCGETRETLEF